MPSVCSPIDLTRLDITSPSTAAVPQVALLVNERTLLPALMPLAPAATMPARVADQVGAALAAYSVPDLVIRAEVDQMRQWRIAPTANRSVVGIMNEFGFLADTWRRRVWAWIRRKHPKSNWKELRRRYCGGGWWDQPSPLRGPVR
ncbi:DUF6933 domain-containing protein [Micromonospora eburnea]|uniref:DUF6933 domain-containing protein n=1 Tax=Micromonospora eburnea TaxID=227316 RepID=A0A1C6TR53_9ACTN|nr:hypothetical protein [Micromonospora eburnea]SCL44133.1 hypothetical protein GA0070604_0216 [Micromonospora eburnea]